MNNELITHYNDCYQYPLPEGIHPADAVTGLFDRIIQGDKTAGEQAVRILSANTYYLVVDRLSKCAAPTISDMDNVMQDVRMQILKLFFRGIPQKITKDGFYGYLLNLVERRIKDYQRKMGRQSMSEVSATGENGMLDALSAQPAAPEQSDPELICLMDERRDAIRQVIHYYLLALKETEMPPQQVLTYCYATLLPQLFKKSVNPDFLERVEQISGRNDRPPSSWYNKEEKRLEGDIARDSVVLMKWTFNAMEQMCIKELNAEFLELYHMEPLNKEDFSWGKTFVENMQQRQEGIPLEQVVILEKYSKHAIKNWPVRVADSLLEETEKRIQENRPFCDKSIGIVEDLIGREG